MEKKNLILDLGGVILDINYQLTIDAFKSIGIPHAEKLYSQQSQIPLFDLLEKGLITEEEFFNDIRAMSDSEHDDEDLRKCWNAILIGLPEENVKTLYDLKKKYRLFLLSNTNSIHEAAYRKMIIDQYRLFIFDDIFEKMYLSHIIHLRKPNAEIFEYVIGNSSLNKSETFFIDDSIQHVEAARKVGIESILMPKGKLLKEVI
ncbi:MAG TPA: HAD-IA family hydrolase [Bacteroidia bacterium]|nr:HAD-IA family hydrolase [Bacteroidota bacterium]HQV99634.1 HAD-IA family hydrolase [Bacteroidia bacterium]